MKTKMDAVLGHLFSAVQKLMVTIFGQFKGCTNKLDTPFYFYHVMVQSKSKKLALWCTHPRASASKIYIHLTPVV